MALQVGTELGNVIGGRTVAAVGARLDLVDPSSGETYGTAPDSDGGSIDRACLAASEAFPPWSKESPATRAQHLIEAASVLEEHAEELGRLEVIDTGKPWWQMSGDEMPAIVDQVRFFAGACRTLEGRAAGEYLDGVVSTVRREPVGVCGQITPWNYPLMMAVWKWAPAVAAGNAVVLKPSELTPSSTVRMAELLASVLPPGVLNVVCGGPAAGEALVRHPAVSMISLTGSARAGRSVAMTAAERFVRVHLELGGNAPVIVFADADLESAARAIGGAAFYNAGQDCTAASRVLVEASVLGDFADLLVDVARSTRTGPPSDEGAAYGPMISSAQRERVDGLVEGARRGTGRVLCGGSLIEGPGYFYPPTVLAGVSQADAIVQDEIFGPVVTVQPFVSGSAAEEEAVTLANGVRQGLTASVWTSDVGRAMRFTRALDFGAVSVNVHAPMASEMPHGGFGASGYGKDLSVYGLEDYTRLKHVAVAL